MNNFPVEETEVLKHILSASYYDESSWQLVEGPMSSATKTNNPIALAKVAVKKSILRFLGRRGFVLLRRVPYSDELRQKGIDWPFFGFTMVGHKRLENIEACVETIVRDKVPGDFMETGVWRGGASIFMKAVLTKHGQGDRVVWCADSFEGLPPPNSKDLELDAGSDFSDRDFLSASQEEVAANFAKFGLLDENVKFLKGWFRDTLPSAPIEQLAILRLDGDLYESTMDSLTNLYPKVVKGGFLIVDDYYSWSGCREAIDEYRDKNNITSEIVRIDESGCFWRVGD